MKGRGMSGSRKKGKLGWGRREKWLDCHEAHSPEGILGEKSFCVKRL